MNYTHKTLRNFFLFTSSFLLAALAAAAANAATPEVTSVTMEQSATTREVTISYTLDNAPAVVTLDIQTNATVNGGEVWTSIGGEHIWNAEGAVWRKVTAADLQDGSYRITWRPDLSWPDHKIAANGVRAVVTAWALDNPPDYMVADISLGARPGTQRYYPAVEFLPGSVLGQVGAVTNNPAYKSSMLVMRKIMAKGVIWTMGSTAVEPKHQSNEATHQVSLDSNYYMGVFEITQSQWGLIATNSTMVSAFKDLERKGERAMDGPTFNEIRNTHRTSAVTDNQRLDVSAGPGGVYPAAPSDDSFLGLLRLRTGLDFDLPGEAQWEFACRAGHGDGKYGDGSTILTGTGSGEVNLARIARFPGNCNNKCNGSKQGTPFTDTNIPWNTTSCDAKAAIGGTAVVGSYAPNDWGLYDMLGNLNEYCLDFYVDNIAALAGAVNTTDPGTATGNGILRVIRGGCAYYGDATWCRPAYRSISGSGYTRIFCGFRVVCPVDVQ